MIADARDADGDMGRTPETTSDTEAPSTDSTATDATTAPDTTSAAPQEAEASRGGAPLPAPTDPRATDRGGETARTGDRGEMWTLLVAAFEDAQAARERRTTLRSRLDDRWSINVIRHSADETEPYRIILGRFSSEDAARRAMHELDEEVREQVQPWRLSQDGEEQ